MQIFLLATGVVVLYLIAYHTYGKWLGKTIFSLTEDRLCPSEELRDDKDYVPTSKAVVFGHHFTSIAGTGPIVGPTIGVIWGWLPALLWVVFGSILIGAVHDFGSLVVSLRNQGKSVGEIAGMIVGPRVRAIFLWILLMALTLVLAVFGLVIAAVFKTFPMAIFPCLVQIPWQWPLDTSSTDGVPASSAHQFSLSHSCMRRSFSAMPHGLNRSTPH